MDSSGIMDAVKFRIREIGSTRREIEHISGIAQCHLSTVISGGVKNPGIITVLRLLKAVGLRLVIVDENDTVYYRSDDAGHSRLRDEAR